MTRVYLICRYSSIVGILINGSMELDHRSVSPPCRRKRFYPQEDLISGGIGPGLPKLGVLTHCTKHPKVILTVRHRILSCCSHFSHTSPNISPLLFSTHFIDLSSSKSSSDRSNMSKPNPSTQDFVPAKSTQPEQGSSEQGDAPPPCTSTSPTQSSQRCDFVPPSHPSHPPPPSIHSHLLA